MIKMLIVSPSPHIHSGRSVKQIMYSVLLALIPAFVVSLYVFGIAALQLTVIAIVSCMFFEFAIQKFLLKTDKQSYTDGSAAITGVLLAFNVPSSLPVWMLVLGCFIAIGVGKMTFGGLGNNPFNPALVGRVFLLISFPVQMTNWPMPHLSDLIDAQSGATPLSLMKEGLARGESVSSIMKSVPSYSALFFGLKGGSLGEVSVLALLMGGAFMLYRKIISWHIPISILATMFLFSGILYIYDPNSFVFPLFHLLSGGTMLAVFFMATDMVTSPMSKPGMLVYGVFIGLITIIIRDFGAYPEGISFAILFMNALVPLINKYIKPQRFGHKK
ncbi:MAG: RnfABCDGE type electron transport complex subunit D [Bacteroidales bacterium]|nr:RnfABCDGE type electron transport complex subunit D [Bacteroidales bacterium]